MASLETISICCRIVTGVPFDNGSPEVRRLLRPQCPMMGGAPAPLHLAQEAFSEGYLSAELHRPPDLTARVIRYADRDPPFRVVDCCVA